MRGKVGGRWQEIVVIKVVHVHSRRVEVLPSNQGVTVSQLMMKFLHRQKTGVLLRTDCWGGSCGDAVPPRGFGSQFRKSRIPRAGWGLQQTSRKLETRLEECLHGLVQQAFSECRLQN